MKTTMQERYRDRANSLLCPSLAVHYPSKMKEDKREPSDRIESDERVIRTEIRCRNRKRSRPGRRGDSSSPMLLVFILCFLGGSLLDNVPLLQKYSHGVLLSLVSAKETNNDESGRTGAVVGVEHGHSRFVRTNPSSRDPPAVKQRTLSLNQIFVKAGRRGIGGGIPGAIAGIVQVVTLMWLRTIMSYQCRYGTTFLQALTTLMNEGGVARLYKGWYLGLIQAPVTRFVSTAANDGVDSLLSNISWTESWGPGRSTFVASIVVGLFRMILMRTLDMLNALLAHSSSQIFSHVTSTNHQRLTR